MQQWRASFWLVSDALHIDGLPRLLQAAQAGCASSSASSEGCCVLRLRPFPIAKDWFEVNEQAKLPMHAGLAAADFVLFEVARLRDRYSIYH